MNKPLFALTWLLFAMQETMASGSYAAAHAHMANRSWDTGTVVVVAILTVPILAVFIAALVQYLRQLAKHY